MSGSYEETANVGTQSALQILVAAPLTGAQSFVSIQGIMSPTCY